MKTITAGIANSLLKNREIKVTCPSCSLGIPKYRGCYPRSCPNCGHKDLFRVEESSLNEYITTIVESFQSHDSILKQRHGFKTEFVKNDVVRGFLSPQLLENKDLLAEALYNIYFAENVDNIPEDEYSTLFEEFSTTSNPINSQRLIKLVAHCTSMLHENWDKLATNAKKLYTKDIHEINAEVDTLRMVTEGFYENHRIHQLLVEHISFASPFVENLTEAIEYASDCILLEFCCAGGMATDDRYSASKKVGRRDRFDNREIVGGIRLQTRGANASKRMKDLQRKIASKRNRKGTANRIRSTKQMLQRKNALKKAVAWHKRNPSSPKLHKAIGRLAHRSTGMYESHEQGASTYFSLRESEIALRLFSDGGRYEQGNVYRFSCTSSKLLESAIKKGEMHELKDSVLSTIYHRGGRAVELLAGTKIKIEDLTPAYKWKGDYPNAPMGQKIIDVQVLSGPHKGDILQFDGADLALVLNINEGIVLSDSISEIQECVKTGNEQKFLPHGAIYIQERKGCVSEIVISCYDSLLSESFAGAILREALRYGHITSPDTNIRIHNDPVNYSGLLHEVLVSKVAKHGDIKYLSESKIIVEADADKKKAKKQAINQKYSDEKKARREQHKKQKDTIDQSANADKMASKEDAREDYKQSMDRLEQRRKAEMSRVSETTQIDEVAGIGAALYATGSAISWAWSAFLYASQFVAPMSALFRTIEGLSKKDFTQSDIIENYLRYDSDEFLSELQIQEKAIWEQNSPEDIAKMMKDFQKEGNKLFEIYLEGLFTERKLDARNRPMQENPFVFYGLDLTSNVNQDFSAYISLVMIQKEEELKNLRTQLVEYRKKLKASRKELKSEKEKFSVNYEFYKKDLDSLLDVIKKIDELMGQYEKYSKGMESSIKFFKLDAYEYSTIRTILSHVRNDDFAKAKNRITYLKDKVYGQEVLVQNAWDNLQKAKQGLRAGYITQIGQFVGLGDMGEMQTLIDVVDREIRDLKKMKDAMLSYAKVLTFLDNIERVLVMLPGSAQDNLIKTYTKTKYDSFLKDIEFYSGGEAKYADITKAIANAILEKESTVGFILGNVTRDTVMVYFWVLGWVAGKAKEGIDASVAGYKNHMITAQALRKAKQKKKKLIVVDSKKKAEKVKTQKPKEKTESIWSKVKPFFANMVTSVRYLFGTTYRNLPKFLPELGRITLSSEYYLALRKSKYSYVILTTGDSFEVLSELPNEQNKFGETSKDQLVAVKILRSASGAKGKAYGYAKEIYAGFLSSANVKKDLDMEKSKAEASEKKKVSYLKKLVGKKVKTQAPLVHKVKKREYLIPRNSMVEIISVAKGEIGDGNSKTTMMLVRLEVIGSDTMKDISLPFDVVYLGLKGTIQECYFNPIEFDKVEALYERLTS